MGIVDVESIVKECIEELLEEYNDHKENFLTEGDVTSSLFCMLKAKLGNHGSAGIKVHRELRPYIKVPQASGSGRHVIKIVEGKAKWSLHDPPNSGSVIDIVLTSSGMDYFESAETIALKRKRKYWRLLTYPLEAFLVCIEVKIRVSGNIRRIEKDVKKLGKIRHKLRELGKNCFVFLVVVDRFAEGKSKKKIEEYCEKHDVLVFIARSHKCNRTD